MDTEADNESTTNDFGPPWWRPFPSPLDYLQEPSMAGTLMRKLPRAWCDGLEEWTKANPGGNPWNRLMAQKGFDQASLAILAGGASQHHAWHKLAKIISGVGSMRRDFVEKLRTGQGTKRDLMHLYTYWDRPQGHALIEANLPAGLRAQRDAEWEEFRVHKARQGAKGQAGRRREIRPIPSLAGRLVLFWLSGHPARSGVQIPGFAYMSDSAIAAALDEWFPAPDGKCLDDNLVKSKIRQLGLKRVQTVVSQVIVRDSEWRLLARDGSEIKPRPATDT